MSDLLLYMTAGLGNGSCALSSSNPRRQLFNLVTQVQDRYDAAELSTLTEMGR